MTELVVVSDPSGDFRPGDAYAESDVAFWLREGELAEGLREAANRELYRGQTFRKRPKPIPTDNARKE